MLLPRPQVSSREEAIAFSNMYAPEHLIVNVEDAEDWLPHLDNAGGFWVGVRSGATVDHCTCGVVQGVQGAVPAGWCHATPTGCHQVPIKWDNSGTVAMCQGAVYLSSLPCRCGDNKAESLPKRPCEATLSTRLPARWEHRSPGPPLSVSESGWNIATVVPLLYSYLQV